MIEATVTREGEVIISRTYAAPNLTLEAVIKKLEAYIVDEQLNVAGECTVRVTFAKPKQEEA